MEVNIAFTVSLSALIFVAVGSLIMLFSTENEKMKELLLYALSLSLVLLILVFGIFAEESISRFYFCTLLTILSLGSVSSAIAGAEIGRKRT